MFKNLFLKVDRSIMFRVIIYRVSIKRRLIRQYCINEPLVKLLRD